jgi:hypothetical protein
MNAADTAALIALIEPLARQFRGEPNQRLSRGDELRFGTNGSFKIDLKLGTWFDFEANEGGGVLDLVKREMMLSSDREAFEWLEREGLWKNGRGGDYGKKVVVASFDYHDRDGTLAFVVERVEFQQADGSFVKENGKHKKRFWQKRPDPDRSGKWIYDKEGCPALPYRLPQLIEAVAAGHCTYVVEGEGKANLLWSWNVPATCNAGGSANWTKAHAEYLRGADVVIVGDNDDAGRNFVRKVGTSLKDIATSVSVLELPGLGPKEDIKDWAEKGGTVEAFNELVERAAKPFEEADDDTLPALRWHGDIDVRDSRPWAVQDLLPEVGSGLLSGQWGTYKTFTGFDLAHAVMSGEPFLGFEVVRRGGVLFIAAEGQSEVAIRLQGVIEDKGKIEGRAPFAWVETCPPLIGADALAVLSKLAERAAAKLRADFDLPLTLIVIDTVVAAAGYSKDGQDNDTALGQVLMRTLAGLARNASCFVLGIDHFGKDVNVGTRGSSAKEGAAEIVFAMLGDKTIEGEITNTRLALRKRRSGPSGQEFPFTARSVDMGTDQHGKPVTTLVLDWGEAAPKAKAKDDWGRGKGTKALRRVIMGLLVDQGTDLYPFANGPMVRALKLDLVRAEFIKSWPADGETERARQNAKTLACRRAIEAAVEKGVIKVREIDGAEVVWLASVTVGPCKDDMDF